MAGKFTQAQREPSVNDGGVQHLPDYETEVMQGWEPKQVTDAMSTALGPWFVQVRCHHRHEGWPSLTERR